MRVAVAAAAAAALALTAAGPAAAQQRPKWDTRVLARVPSPGFPAKPYVDPSGRVYEGTYVNMAGDALPSKVFEFSPDAGNVIAAFTVRDQDLAAAHGVQVATSDAAGRLVLLDRTPSRALTLDPATGRFEPYATFPDLDASDGVAPFADYAAWGPDGALYVTDYAQAVVFRVPPHGGAAEVWLKDDRLKGGMFGTAGIVYLAEKREFLITQASGLGGAPGNPATGHLYAVGLGADGKPGALRSLWESQPGDLPDGFAVSAAGNVYIALVGLPAQLVELSPDGTELTRFPSTPGSGENGSGVPFDSPSGIAFRGTSLVVANQSAIAGDPSHQVLLDVEVAEPGLPEFIPAGAGALPLTATSNPPGDQASQSGAAAVRTAVRRSRRGRVVRLKLSRAITGAPARVRVLRRGRVVGTGSVRKRTLTVTLRRGALLSGRITVRPLRPKRTKLTSTPVDVVRTAR